MIGVLIVTACFFVGTCFYLNFSGYTNFDPRYWMLFSLITSTGLFVYTLSRYFSDKKNVMRRCELMLFIGLFSVCNSIEWDIDHSGWGIGAGCAGARCAGLFGTFEPVFLDFKNRSPKLSDRISSLLGVQEKQEPSMLRITEDKRK